MGSSPIVHGCPSALAVVAARIATNNMLSLTDAAANLRDGDNLSSLADPETELDVRNVFSWSYRGLQPLAARVFPLLGMRLGPEISVSAVASLAALPPWQARTVLDELANVHLVEERSPGRYGVHDLLCAYARELLAGQPGTAQRAARHRLLDYYLHAATTATATLFPYHTLAPIDSPIAGVVEEDLDTPQRAQTWLRTELPTLLAIVSQAGAIGFAAHAWRTAAALEIFLDRQGRRSDQVTVQRVAVVKRASRGRPVQPRPCLPCPRLRPRPGRRSPAGTQTPVPGTVPVRRDRRPRRAGPDPP